MKIKGEFVLREIAGEHILIPVGNTAMEINGMITVDDVGCFIWKALEEGKEKEQILKEILEQYEVDKEIAEKDLTQFLDQLKEAKLIE